MRTILLAILLIGGINSYSQSSWVTKQLGNNLSVKFPTSPQYKLVDKTGTYVSKTSNNLFFASVSYDVIPNYSEFVKLPQQQQQDLIEVFLKNTMNGILLQSGISGTTYKSFKVGNLKGLESAYSSINPASGEPVMKYCKIVYAFNKLFMFQTMNLDDLESDSNERNIFFNSIKIS